MKKQNRMSGEPSDMSKVEGGEENRGRSPDEMRRELEEEFNVQRAKMKELFLQKEDDMRKMIIDKEQLESEVVGLRAQLQQLMTLSQNQSTEIQDLQMLVRETVEESSLSSEDARRLRARNMELEQQLGQLRQQMDVSIAPATLVRSLARKLGAEPDTEQPARKATVAAAEEDELARSAGHPRELEIAALKGKLRDTDARLQDALAALKAKSTQTNSTGAAVTETELAGGGGGGGGEGARPCDMCANYERQLVLEQRQSEAARDRVSSLDLALRQATEELEGVRSIHDETVRTWHEERAATGLQLEELRAAVEEARQALESKAAAATQASEKALEHVTTLTVDRETLQRKLDTLERDNAMLIGQYTKIAAEMQNEVIDLPDNVEDLQEYALHLREQLIFCQIGRENALESERELRNQVLEYSAQLHRQEEEFRNTHRELQRNREELDRLQTEREQMRELAERLRASSDTIEQLLEDKKRLHGEVSELRGRVSSLQQELDNSEKVQQDFVRLSQSLQVQLQRIREADTEVRWQHEEDVTECPACHAHLHNNKKKVHCRHCGRIFCAACASQTVASGPRGLPARVCAVCRTLLQPHAAPYFSTQPPHSPD